MAVLRNPKHDAFAHARARGCTQREAYEAADYNPKNKAVDQNAHSIERRPEVKARIAELIDEHSAALTRRGFSVCTETISQEWSFAVPP